MNIIRPGIVLQKFSDFWGLPSIGGLPCPECCPKDSAQAVEEARQREIDNLLRLAGVPVKFRQVSLDNFRVGSELQQAEIDRQAAQERAQWKAVLSRYLDRLEENIDNGVGLSLFGSVGTGKTLALCIVANALASLKRSFVIVPERGIFDAIKATYDDSSDVSDRDVLGTFRELSVLMIDDFGIRRASDWAVDTYHDLIDSRWDRGLATFVSSNRPENDLAKSYPRQMDRLSHNIRIQMNGPSLRGSAMERGSE